MFFVRFLLLEEMFEKQSNLSRDYRYCHKKRASFGVDFSTRHARAVGTGKTGCPSALALLNSIFKDSLQTSTGDWRLLLRNPLITTYPASLIFFLSGCAKAGTQ